jgi:hypothetical protein
VWIEAQGIDPDLFFDDDGIFHGYRTVGGGVQHILGRETCLGPVSWWSARSL